MAQITVTVHERPYQVMCEDGQEDHVRRLAAYVDQRVRELAGKSGVPGPAGQVTESRLLVMAALMVADELGEAYDELEEIRSAPPRTVPDPATLKAAEEARGAASAARAQLAEAEATLRAALQRSSEAEASRNAADADAERDRAALSATEQRAAAAEQRAASAEARASEVAQRVSAAEEAARAAEARALELGDAARNARAAATQAEAALQAAGRRIAENEVLIQEAERERSGMRATLASLSAQSASARDADDVLASGLESLAQQIDEMASRVERSAARQ